MNWRGIWAVARKDTTVIVRTKAVMLPLIIVPIILQIVMPTAFGILATFLPMGDPDAQEVLQLLDNMPPTIREEVAGMDQRQVFLYLMVVYLFAPLYLVVPLMVSSVVAADSFAGEKERKTLEALLHSPMTGRELLIGKILSALIPAVLVSVFSFILYALVLNIVGWPLMGRIFFPNPMWLLLVFWVAPAVSLLGLGITVIVSTRVNTFQEAYQLGGLVVLPVVALMISQVSGVIYLSPIFVFVLGLIVWLLDAGMIWAGMRFFRRENLLAQL